MLAGLLAPLRLPERVMGSLESLAEAAAQLQPIRTELTKVRNQTEPLGRLLPALDEIRKPLGKLLPALESVREQTEPLADLLPALERIREQTEPLGDVLPALERLEEALKTRLDSVHAVVASLESDQSELNETVEELVRQMVSMHETLVGLQGDVQRITKRLPDPDRGPLEKAKDVLTGS